MRLGMSLGLAGVAGRKTSGGAGGGGGGAGTYFLTPDNTVWGEAFTQHSGQKVITVVDDPINPGRNVWDSSGIGYTDIWTFDEAGESDTWDIKALVLQYVTTGGTVAGPIANAQLVLGATKIAGFGAITSNYGPNISTARFAVDAIPTGDGGVILMQDSADFDDDFWEWIHLRTEPTGVPDEIRLRIRTWRDADGEPAEEVWLRDHTYIWNTNTNGVSSLPSLVGKVGFLHDFHTTPSPYLIGAIGIGKDGAVAPTS